jgi:hypothetical protein
MHRISSIELFDEERAAEEDITFFIPDEQSS